MVIRKTSWHRKYMEATIPFGIVCEYRYVNFETSKDAYTTEQYAEFEKAAGK